MSRKKSKPLSGGGIGRLRILRTEKPQNPRVIQGPWGDISIDELFDGRKAYTAIGNSRDGFSGRPRLAEEISEVLQKFAARGSKITVRGRITALRALWRALDQEDSLGVLAPVHSVADLTLEHGFQIQRALVVPSAYKVVKTIVQAARRARRLSPLSWPASDSGETLAEKDLPSAYAVSTIYFELKCRVRELHSRWDSCASQISQGKDLTKSTWTNWSSRKSGLEKWSIANRVATYAALDASSLSFVTTKDLADCFGKSAQKNQLVDTAGYFYPVKRDALLHLWLLLLHTGWNAQVAIDLDIHRPDLATPHPTVKPKVTLTINPTTGEESRESFPLMVLRGAKSRSEGHIQSAISNSHQSTAAYPLLMRYIKQTKKLREMVVRALAEAEKEFKKYPENRALELEVNELRKDACSPWLFRAQRSGEDGAHPSPRPIMRLSLDNYHSSGSGSNNWPGFIENINQGISNRIVANAARERESHSGYAAAMLRLDADLAAATSVNDKVRIHQIQSTKARLAPQVWKVPELIPKTFTLKMLRDVFINNAYASSGFNIFVAQAAAGHRSGSSIQNYLRNQFRRRQNYARGRDFQRHLFNEMRQGVVDPVILRKLVDDGEITREQRIRWLSYKDRTRQGTGCVDPKNPPTEIAPEHVKGQDCRIQRCVICRHALVFADSLDPIACRIAELQRMQATIPLLAWNNSSFNLELSKAIATLELPEFNSDEVAARVAFWLNEIAAGRHIVVDMEGAYA